MIGHLPVWSIQVFGQATGAATRGINSLRPSLGELDIPHVHFIDVVL